MADEFESLVLEASVLDNFSKELEKLSNLLTKVAGQEESVDPIDIDARVAEALADIESVDAMLTRLDNRRVDAHVDVDRDNLREKAAEAEALVSRQVEAREKGLSTFPGRKHDLDIMQRQMQERTPLLHLPETDVIPDLDVWRRRNVDRGLKQNLTDVIQEFSELKLTMSFLMNVLAGLIPLLIVFIGTLPMAIAAIGSLAAAALIAAGALAGLGALGVGAMLIDDGELNAEQLQESMQDLFDSFAESFDPIFDSLRPLMDSFFSASELFATDLASSMSSLMTLTDEMAGVLSWMASVFTDLVEEGAAFTEAVAPVLGFIVGGMGDIDWFGVFASVIADALPHMTEFAAIIMRILPVIFELSMGFAHVANAILMLVAFVSTLFDFLDRFMPFTEIVGGFIATVLTAITVTSLWTLAMSDFGRIVGAVIARLAALSAQAIQQAIASITGYTISMWQAYVATAALVGLLSAGLIPILTGLAGTAMGMKVDANGMTADLQRFSKSSSRGGASTGAGVGTGPTAPAYSSVTENTVVAPDKETGNAVANVLRFTQGDSSTTNQGNVTSRHHST